MNYAEFTSKFWQSNKNLQLSTSAITIYFFLVNRWFISDNTDFVLSDLSLSKELSLSTKTIRTNKKQLQAHKLIQFEARVGCPCSYSMMIEQFASESTSKSSKVVKKIKVKRSNSKSKIKKYKAERIIADDSFDQESEHTQICNNANIPSLLEFISYAKSLKNYTSDADSKIEKKYNDWVKNRWCNDYGRPIINWKIFLKSMMQYIIDSSKNEDKIDKIPTIKNPKV